MKKYEYTFTQCNWITTDPTVELNELGKQGWELVAVTPQRDPEWARFYLKREINETENS